MYYLYPGSLTPASRTRSDTTMGRHGNLLICLLLLPSLMGVVESVSEKGNDIQDDWETSIQDLRVVIDNQFKVLNKKLEWMITDGKPAPSNVSHILEVMKSIQEVQASCLARSPLSRTITVRINSEGCCGIKEPGGIAPLYEGPIFYLNNRTVDINIRGRGYNFFVISRKTGQFLKAENFDTWLSERSSNKMQEFVRDLPYDSIVAVSAIDGASRQCRDTCKQALTEIGATVFPTGRDGYALIGYKGTHCGSRPSWMKEMKRSSSGYRGGNWSGDRARGGYGPAPISLVTKINLDDCI